jgi:hypothetical protein
VPCQCVEDSCTSVYTTKPSVSATHLSLLFYHQLLRSLKAYLPYKLLDIVDISDDMLEDEGGDVTRYGRW